MTAERWKLVYQPLTSGYRLSLYDTAADPGCRDDVAARRPDVRDAMWRELVPFLVRDGVIDDAQLASAAS